MKKSLPWVIMACAFFLPRQSIVAATLELPLAVPAGEEPWGEQVIDFDAGMTLPGLSEVRLRLPRFVCPMGNGCVMQSGTLIFQYDDLVSVTETRGKH